MGQAALQYARLGWPVFPCRERDGPFYVDQRTKQERRAKAKQPYIGNGLKAATLDEPQILQWWRRNPDAMIGLPQGVNGYFVIDFDPRWEEVIDPATGEVQHDEAGEIVKRLCGLEELKAALEAQMGVPLPRSVTAMTPSGGVHVYFRQPDGEPIRNRGNLPDHVDVRGAGGYVIGAPSRCLEAADSATGEYRWLRDRGDWRDPAAYADAPAELIAILRAPKAGKDKKAAGDQPASTSSSPPRRVTGSDDPVEVAVRKWALSALAGEEEKLRNTGLGGRNTQANASAFRVGQLVGAGALGEGMARSVLQAAVSGFNDVALHHSSIENGLTAGIANPRDLTSVIEGARRRADRGPSRPRTPSSSGDNGPSSQPGGSLALARQEKGQEGDHEIDLARKCALLPQTDLGNLQRFMRRYGSNFLFVEQWGWLAWDGKRWSRDMAVPLLGRAVQDTMRAIQDEAELVRESGVPEAPEDGWDAEQIRAHEQQQREKLDRVVKVARDGTVTYLSDTISKWGRTSEGASHIKALPGMAEARLAARTYDFDKDPLRLNVGNGTLVFARPEAGEAARVRLVPFERKDRITKIAATEYHPDAGSPIFDAFLEEVQPDPEMRQFLDVWSGYNSLGLADAQKMAIFYGQGSNGKGVWLNTMAHILGDYAWAAAIETFIDQGKYRKGSDASPDLAALAGRRMVYANEPEEGSKFSDGLIKSMTSDEPIGGVRELLKPPFQLEVTFTNTVAANHKPRIGTDHGIQRRVEIIPFDVIVPTERADPLLKAKLKAEAVGIFNRMVRGALTYLNSGLPRPKAIMEATRSYQEENDILGQFLNLCIEKAPGETIGSTLLHELFAAWQAWAQLLPANGKPWSPKYLAAQLEKKGFKKRKSSSMVWDGMWALYSASDFVDGHGKPIADDLPSPRTKDGQPASTPSPDPSIGGAYTDDEPL
nr:phage/plasmid primase, P4 family [Sphingomonas sp. GM_Shp_2]